MPKFWALKSWISVDLFCKLYFYFDADSLTWKESFKVYYAVITSSTIGLDRHSFPGDLLTSKFNILLQH